MKNLSVIIPCFNEEETILLLIEKVLNQSNVGEVIIIDDCSTDRSYQLLKTIKDNRCLVLKQDKNKGKGAAVSRGFESASLEFCVIQDADLEYDPTDYQALLQPLMNGKADVVFGSRFISNGPRRALYFWHRVGNNLLTLFSNMATNIDLTDMETCYKMMKTKYAKLLEIEEPRFGIEPEMTAKLAAMKIRIFEVPISYNGRTYDEGKKITWKDGFSALRCIFKYNTRKQKKKQIKKIDSPSD
jgi:glycosyltransferase involved in cell wall biosynthesis